ncbi:MAG: plasmid pRiA4b ORF-3 family protein [Promethearchaeia archaeon]
MATDLDNQNNDFLRFWDKITKIFTVQDLIHLEYPWRIFDFDRGICIYSDLDTFIDKALSKFDKKEEKLDIKFYEGEENIICIDYKDKEILKKFLNYLFNHALLFRLNIFLKKIRDFTLLKELIEEKTEIIEVNLYYKEKLNKNQAKDLIELGKAYNFKITKSIISDIDEYFINFYDNLIEFNNNLLDFIFKVKERFDLNDIGLFLTKDFSKIINIDDSYNNVYQFKVTLSEDNISIWRRIQVPENYTFREFHVAIQNAMGWNDEHLNEFYLKNPKTGNKVIILFGNRYEDIIGYRNEIVKNFIKNPKKTLEEYKKIIELKENGKIHAVWEKIYQSFYSEFYSDEEIKNGYFYTSYEDLPDELKAKISSDDFIKHYIIFLVIINKSLEEYYLDKDVKISDFFTNKNKKCEYIYDLGDDWMHEIELEGIYPRDYKINYPICLEGEGACPLENSGSINGTYHYFKILQNPNHPEYERVLNWIESLSPPHWIGKVEKYNPKYFNKDDVIFLDPKRYIKKVTSRDFKVI